MSRLSRRDLLKGLGYTVAASSAVAAAPVAQLLDDRTLIAADAPAISFGKVGAPSNSAQMQAIARLDDTHRMFPDGSMEVLLRPGDVERLRAVGVDVTVLQEDLLSDRRVQPSRPLRQQPGERDAYRRWEDFEADLRSLEARFPSMARIVAMPHASLLGRRIFGIEIATDVNRRDGRPVVHIDGMHHCREWPAAEMPIMWAFDLLESYGSDARITNIVDNARTIIVPNLNPDGFIRSRDSMLTDDQDGFERIAFTLATSPGSQEGYWRKNLRNVSGVNHNVEPLPGQAPRRGNVDSYGIDMNRNYGFLWGDDEGSSGFVADQTYRGTRPYSEPEARNIRWSFLRSAPITAITHHTSGRIMLHPWGRDPDSHRTRDWQVLNGIGLAMATSNGYEPKQSFGLYPTSGTSRDWGHAATSTLIWTFEHGTEFHGRYADTIPEMYEINRGAFLTHAEAALDPATHLVVNGVVTRDGTPVPARVVAFKEQLTPVTPGAIESNFVPDPLVVEMFITDAEAGMQWHLPPSTRPFFESAPADPDDIQIPRGNAYPGGMDPVLASHGMEPGTEAYIVLAEYDGSYAITEVTGGRGDVVDLGTLELGPSNAAVEGVLARIAAASQEIAQPSNVD